MLCYRNCTGATVQVREDVRYARVHHHGQKSGPNVIGTMISCIYHEVTAAANDISLSGVKPLHTMTKANNGQMVTHGMSLAFCQTYRQHAWCRNQKFQERRKRRC